MKAHFLLFFLFGFFFKRKKKPLKLGIAITCNPNFVKSNTPGFISNFHQKIIQPQL